MNFVLRTATRLLMILIVVFVGTVSAQLYKLETENSKIVYYSEGYKYLVPHVGANFEAVMNFHKKYWNYLPAEKTLVFLNDLSDVGNGGACSIPRNMLMANIAPFEFTFDIMPANERFHWLMNHELTHIVMADKPAGSDKFFRGLFGGKVSVDNEFPVSMLYSYWTSPRWYSPRWYHEGIAVFMETWMSGGLGRALGGYDEMAFRAIAKENAYLYKPIGLETEGTTIDFQVGVNSYLYGTRFVAYLSYMYGMDKLKEFYNRESGSYGFYAPQFEKTYGRDVVEVWDEWNDFEKKFQLANIEKTGEEGLTPVNYFSDEIFGSASKQFYNKETNEMYCAINRPGGPAVFTALNLSNGHLRELKDVESAGLYYVTLMAWNKDKNEIYTTTHNSSWRGLKSFEINSGDEETIFDYIRITDMDFSETEKCLYAIQVNNARTSIVKFTPDFKTGSNLYSIPFGYSIFNIDISPDGKKLSSTFADASGRQKLMLYDLESLNAGKIDTTTVYEFEDNSASDFRFSRDGKSLIGTSYYTGVSNVFEIDIETKQASILTNTDIGFFRPIEISDDTLLVFEYCTKGLRPVKIKKEKRENAGVIEYLGMRALEKNPELYTTVPQSASEYNNESLILEEGEYIPFSETGFESVFPIVEGYKDFAAYGIQMNFSDELMLSRLKLKASYTPNKFLPEKQRLHLAMQFNYWSFNFKAGLNKTNFYDLFGPTKTGRAGYYAGMGYSWDLVFDKPYSSKLSLSIDYFGDLEKLPQYQNIDAGFSELTSLNIDYNYSKLMKTIGGIEDEYGWNIRPSAGAAYFNDMIVPDAVIAFDAGFLTGIRNSSIWIRSAVGKVFTEKESSFSRKYFGGFGNNYVDRLNVQQYRNIESFAGRGINEISAKDFAKVTAEWNLPPIMFREFGFLSAYIRFARLSVFGTALASDISDKDFRRFHYNSGAQLDFELVFFTLLKSTLSVGYARAYEKDTKPGNEFMISLKLL